MLLSVSSSRAWVADAIACVNADAQRSADTHLFRAELPQLRGTGIDVYFKDESAHPSGSLKHRLARSLFLYALCNGWLSADTPVIEASSGSTAVSEAYFAQMLGLEFIAVMPDTTSPEKIALIEFYGGRCHLVTDAASVCEESQRLATECDGHFMDQFTYAERATDWRGNNNIAESLFAQMQLEAHPTPAWIVVGAGTGGSSATIGRYLRYRSLPTLLCVVDPENSAFYPGWVARDPHLRTQKPSRIEGIGRQRVEPSFVPDVIDHMLCVPDAASIAAARYLSEVLGRRVGGSTGTNLWGVLQLARRMQERDERGSIVTLLCDPGDRYAHTYYSDEWVREHGLDLTPYEQILRSGNMPDTPG